VFGKRHRPPAAFPDRGRRRSAAPCAIAALVPATRVFSPWGRAPTVPSASRC